MKIRPWDKVRAAVNLEPFIHLQIVQADHIAEYKSVASHVSPGLALYAASSFYFNHDAVNMAAIDNLINFTRKVGGWVGGRR